MKVGDYVRIVGTDHGACVGTVQQISRPEMLPELRDMPGQEFAAAPRVNIIQQILDEWDVDEIWWINYRANRRHGLLFAAMHHRNGRVTDLKGQELTITPFPDPSHN